MRQSIPVSRRGQITLPMPVRKRLGIESGGMVIVEEKEGELILRTGVVMEIDTYSDEDMRIWDKEDTLAGPKRTAILKSFKP
ncbi:MAG: AbrB/MazE/SpoVT family DNA-binding domain-containing protein [Proteobacteria bacterium]|nr:AbrB/MazE/SpoVT family DNA-binding domain-containing protein [Pseudomonadota bacterium]